MITTDAIIKIAVLRFNWLVMRNWKILQYFQFQVIIFCDQNRKVLRGQRLVAT